MVAGRQSTELQKEQSTVAAAEGQSRTIVVAEQEQQSIELEMTEGRCTAILKLGDFHKNPD